MSETSKNVIILNPTYSQCGVYQHARRFYKQVDSVSSQQLNIQYYEVNKTSDYKYFINEAEDTDLVIVNYYSQANMPYVVDSKNCKNRVASIVHEFGHVTEIKEHPLFKEHLIFDPSQSFGNILPNIYNFERPFPYPYTDPFDDETSSPKFFNIGSFGYYFANKGFERILGEVLKLRPIIGIEDFAKIRVRFHITKPTYSGYSQDDFDRSINNLRVIAGNFDINLVITTDTLSDTNLHYFLQENHLNMFLYDDNIGRGISSAIDFAIMADRPIIVSNSGQFRHTGSYFNYLIYKIPQQFSTPTPILRCEFEKYLTTGEKRRGSYSISAYGRYMEAARLNKDLLIKMLNK